MALSKVDTNIHPRTIVTAYADLLAAIKENKGPSPLKIIPESLPESILPYPSKTIRHALAIYLLHHDYSKHRGIIEDAYLQLDNFIPEDEYDLFYSLQSSKNTRDDSYNNVIHILNIMKSLRFRTENIRERKKESIEELNAFRRIMELPDNLTDIEHKEVSDYAVIQELSFNL